MSITWKSYVVPGHAAMSSPEKAQRGSNYVLIGGSRWLNVRAVAVFFVLVGKTMIFLC